MARRSSKVTIFVKRHDTLLHFIENPVNFNVIEQRKYLESFLLHKKKIRKEDLYEQKRFYIN